MRMGVESKRRHAKDEAEDKGDDESKWIGQMPRGNRLEAKKAAGVLPKSLLDMRIEGAV